MKALILNSGVGRRMGALTEHHPKCMTSISEEHTIVSWQLTLLKELGVRDVIMTTGPFEDALKEHTGAYHDGIRFVNNPICDKTNYIYSMHLAREVLVGDDILLLHGDLVPERSVLEDLIHASHSAAALEDGIPLPEKDFKARLREGCIAEIGINVFGEDCMACQPAYKLLRGDMERWLNAIDVFCGRGETSVYAENALNTQLETIEMHPLMLRGRLCNEIDNANDLAAVSARFCEYRRDQR